VTDKTKQSLADSIGSMITKAIATGEVPEEETPKTASTEEITKSVTEGVLAQLADSPVFKAIAGAQTPAEPDPNADIKKYVRRYVRKAVQEASEVLSIEIIKGVSTSVMEMFGGEEQIKKLNKIGSKLKVVGTKKSQAPVDDGEDDGEEDEVVEKKSKKFAKRDARRESGKRGTEEQLDKHLGKMAREALKG